AIVKCTQAHLKNGNEVIIPGIGILTIKDAKERMGKNPKTGEPIKIAASKRLGLKVSAEIKRMLNE
nr:HU family DNA-binding protein [Pseudomonadota bacterium]